MSFSPQLDHSLFRILLYRRNGAELLLEHSNEGLALPGVWIPPHTRLAQQITEAIENNWNLQTCCLFPIPDPKTRYYALELTSTSTDPTADRSWFPVESLASSAFREQQDFHGLEVTGELLARYRKDETAGPFSSLGWLQAVTEWIASKALPRGLHLTGKFQQFNASPTFSLIRFETNGVALWFKAVGEPNVREYRITLALAQLLRDYLPGVIASHEPWNAWLSVEAPGHRLADSSSIAEWQCAANSLANLQITSFGNGLHLARTGCRDLRAAVLLEKLDPFFESMAQLMQLQRKQDPPPLTYTDLMALSGTIRRALEELAVSGIPNVLGHLDLNPGNIIAAGEKCVFLDWAEGYIGHPFFAMQYLLEHLRKLRPEASDGKSIFSAYVRPWRAFANDREITSDLECTPLLAAYAYATTAEESVYRQGFYRAEAAAFLRSLTRRMKREADALRDRSAVCAL